ncbi:MAG TPA: LPS assembly lipoprotein LptE [Magnetospirillum sp.]|jgi:LPS-assembly lipoprotein|nr:LPS assembly lipoprotein LptE [Magnetospirillum sp.]
MVLALGPVGCGFEPVYARKDQQDSLVAAELAAVRVGPIEDRLGQMVRNRLVQTLTPRGEAANTRYALEIKLTESLGGLATSKDGNAQVGRLVVSATYVLHDVETSTVLYSGTTRAMSGYRFLGPRYASVSSEREAQSAAATEIAEEIQASLVAVFTNRDIFAERMRSVKVRSLQEMMEQNRQTEMERQSFGAPRISP